MTALDEFDRLEALGIWRSGADEPGREVIVKFGKSTLVIGTGDDAAPLAHWSLAALRMENSGAGSTTYMADAGAGESLTIDDPVMRDALARVMQGQGASAATVRGRGRLWAMLVVLVLVAASVFWLPGLITGVVRDQISPERAALLGSEMLGKVAERTGPACYSVAGSRALARIAARLSGSGKVALHVFDLGDKPLLRLPGGHLLLGRSLVEDAQSPEELAGWAALGLADPDRDPALRGMFRDGDLWDGLVFLASGNLAERAKEEAVNRMLISSTPVGAPSPLKTAALLGRAQVPMEPLRLGLTREGVSFALPVLDEGEVRPLMADQDWVALQQICE